MQSIDGEGEVAGNIEKVIDKPHKTRYILLYKCDEKECAPRERLSESRGKVRARQGGLVHCHF